MPTHNKCRGNINFEKPDIILAGWTLSNLAGHATKSVLNFFSLVRFFPDAWQPCTGDTNLSGEAGVMEQTTARNKLMLTLLVCCKVIHAISSEDFTS